MMTVVTTHLITIREVPKSVNAGGGGARQHHFKAHQEKKRWEGLYLAELMVGRVAPSMCFCAVDIVVKWRRRNHRDVENYRHPVVKPLADALVKGRYLKDDTEEWFAVKDFRFEYPEGPWPWPHPGMTGYMDITLEAHYA